MSVNNLNITQDLINDIKDVSVQASDQINKIYQQYKLGGQNIVLQNKKDHSELTQADLISHDIIYKALKKLTPHIPIVSEERLSVDKPDFVVIFPWNISHEVKTQLSYLTKNGTKFVVAVPNLQIS